MYGYIYLTTNLINNKKYIGKHKASKFESKGVYHGSGVALLAAVKKYGLDNFKVELIEECHSEEELSQREEFYINKFNAVEDENYYNIIPSSNGGDYSKYLDEDKLKQIHKSHSEFMKTFKHSEETKQKMSAQRKGRVLSEETKRKISESNKGKRLGKKDSSETLLLKRNKRLGFIQSEEVKQKISASNKGKRLGYKNSEEVRKIISDANKNLIWMFKEGVQKKVLREQEQMFIEDGWKRGRQ